VEGRVVMKWQVTVVLWDGQVLKEKKNLSVNEETLEHIFGL